MRARRLVVALLVGLAVVLAACGEPAEVVRPAEVDPAMAPRTLGHELELYENTAEETATAFANVGPHTLVADGRLWEIRRKDRLVGTLQITTVLPDVDLTEQRQRDAITAQVLSGALVRLRAGPTEILSVVNQERALYLWFGADTYQVMQLKDRALVDSYNELAADVVRHQATVPSWRPLPVSVDRP